MAIDERRERIYWVDRRQNRIESINILGHDRKIFTTMEVSSWLINISKNINLNLTPFLG